jgi:hypothetical protein
MLTGYRIASAEARESIELRAVAVRQPSRGGLATILS